MGTDPRGAPGPPLDPYTHAVFRLIHERRSHKALLLSPPFHAKQARCSTGWACVFTSMAMDEVDLSQAIPLDSNPLDMIPARIMKRDAKLRMLNAMKRQTLKHLMPDPPEPGYSYHAISNGRSDFWTWLPSMLDWLDGPATDFYATTWTMSRANATECMELFDTGKLQRITFLFGEEFRARETAVYGTLMTGMRARNQRLIICATHAKILLLTDGKSYYTVESSANLTSNPRIEQYVITADPELYEFHRSWIEEVANVYAAREA